MVEVGNIRLRLGEVKKQTDVRQSVGKTGWHSRQPDPARRAQRSRRRCRDARGAPRAAGGRRRARRGARLHRRREEAGRSASRSSSRSRPARWSSRSSTTSWSRRSAPTRQVDRPQRRAAGRDHDGRPAGLRQNHHHRQARQAPHRPAQEQSADGLARHAPSGGDGAARGARPQAQIDTLPIVAGQTPPQIARRAHRSRPSSAATTW